jgi:hypothetical protein
VSIFKPWWSASEDELPVASGVRDIIMDRSWTKVQHKFHLNYSVCFFSLGSRKSPQPPWGIPGVFFCFISFGREFIATRSNLQQKFNLNSMSLVKNYTRNCTPKEWNKPKEHLWSWWSPCMSFRSFQEEAGFESSQKPHDGDGDYILLFFFLLHCGKNTSI